VWMMESISSSLVRSLFTDGDLIRTVGQLLHKEIKLVYAREIETFNHLLLPNSN